MKVILVNGSPHEKGCTFTALSEVASTLGKEGVDTEIFWIGAKPVGGCVACGGCAKLGRCVYDDAVNAFVAKAREADGFVFGSPVHYAAPAGNLCAFMDRAFYSARPAGGPDPYYLKPAAAVVSARRGGNTNAFDRINKYFTIKEMPVVSSSYWNMVFGASPDDVKKDLEGMRTMRVLGRNMAYLLRCIEAARAAGVPLPEKEDRVATNFIR